MFSTKKIKSQSTSLVIGVGIIITFISLGCEKMGGTDVVIVNHPDVWEARRQAREILDAKYKSYEITSKDEDVKNTVLQYGSSGTSHSHKQGVSRNDWTVTIKVKNAVPH
jgi:hypothetical protein